eukprot:jgi/Mesvir1/21866/Mv04243-RA.1
MVLPPMTLQAAFPCGARPYLDNLPVYAPPLLPCSPLAARPAPAPSERPADAGGATDMRMRDPGMRDPGMRDPGIAPAFLPTPLDPSLPYLIIPGRKVGLSDTSCKGSTGSSLPGMKEASKFNPQAAVMTINRGEMMHLANTLGGLLALAGFTEPGIRVALIMENVAEFVPTFYGVSFVRAVNVLLNPMLTANELDFYLRSSAPRLVILTPSSPCKARVTAACEKLGISVWSVSLEADEDPEGALSGQASIPLGNEASTPNASTLTCHYHLQVAWELGALRVPDASPADACAALARQAPSHEDDVLLILGTSGTTGLPKLTPLRQRHLLV